MKLKRCRKSFGKRGFPKISSPNKRWKKREMDDMPHPVAFCIVVCSICATIVGVAMVLGRFDITLRLRYVPRKGKGKKKHPGESF